MSEIGDIDLKIATAPTSQPEKWTYQEHGQTLLPKGSKECDSVGSLVGPLGLYKIPLDLLNEDSKYILEDERTPNKVYAVTTKNRAVRMLMVAEGKNPINGFADIKRSIINLLSSSDPHNTHKIPVVYDQSNGWLTFPIDKGSLSHLSDTEKSSGPSGTHYQVLRMNKWVDALCEEKKIDNIIDDDGLKNVRYFDIQKAPNGGVYIDASSPRLAIGAAESLTALGIATSDQLPIFKGKGSLESLVRTLTGKPNMDEYDISKILKNSLNSDNSERSYKMGDHFVVLRSELVTGRRSRRDEEEEFVDIFQKVYDHANGFRVSAILAEGNNSVDRSSYYLIVGRTHPEVAESIWVDKREKLTFLDGTLHLTVPHGTDSNYGEALNYCFQCTDFTADLDGKFASEEKRRAFAELLSQIEKTSLEDREIRREKGLVIINKTQESSS